MATKHLIEKGHRNIAIVTGELKDHGVNSERYLGYLDALQEAGIQPLEENVFEGYVDYKYGFEVSEKIAKDRNNITGIFVTSDITAIGLMNGLRQLDVSVPGDISVIGFDDVEYAKMCYPGLTTIRQNIQEKGRQAARYIIDVATDPSKRSKEKLIPMTLVERGTVKDLR